MTPCGNNSMTAAGRRTRRLLLIFAVIVSAAAAVGSCSVETRHRLKTVVFTGVPPLQKGGEISEAEPLDPAQAARNEQLIKQQQHREALLPKYWQHGPFAAGECGRCHSLGQSTSFLGNQGADANMPAPAAVVSASSRLSLPKEQLCVTCHNQHGATFVQNLNLEHHQPAADGACTSCHNPHQSLRRYMLHKANNYELCSSCHSPATLSPAHVASQGQDCLGCHNAHVGATSKLLNSDVSELSLLYSGGIRD